MRFSKQILAAVTLAVPFVSAQSLAELPACAKACSNVGITLSLPSSAAGPAKPVTSATSPSAAAAAGHDATSKSSSSPPVTVPTTITTPLSSSSSNGTGSNNITNGTSPPVVPFEGLATSNTFQWASVALLVGTVAAFAGL
ncbi:MAG: hypothetical protein Q9191_006666 [Dirinaria sp. TL-2023a]